MNKINLGQTIQVLANLGVIVGIVFLAMQLQQNNALLGAQARTNRSQLRIDAAEAILSNQELMQAALKERDGQALTALDQFMLQIDASRVFASWQYVYGEYREGLIESQDVPVEDWRRTFSTRPALQNAWREKQLLWLRPDFVQWMDENVIK